MMTVIRLHPTAAAANAAQPTPHTGGVLATSSWSNERWARADRCCVGMLLRQLFRHDLNR